MTSEFNPGDIVVLKSGGPKMTVSAVFGPGGLHEGIDVVWFDGASLRTATLKSDVLEMWDKVKSLTSKTKSIDG